MTTKGSKFVAILLIVVVVAGGAGYWLLAPKTPDDATSIAQGTPVLTPACSKAWARRNQTP